MECKFRTSAIHLGPEGPSFLASEDNFWGFFKGFSLQTTLTVIAVGGYFSTHTDRKIEKLEIALEQQGARVDQQGARTDRLYEMFIDLLKEKNG